jgi:hypothetical protein
MNPNKISAFLDDKLMADSVYQAILRAFLKKSNTNDVQYLAAKTISIDMLNEAWKDLEKFRSEPTQESKSTDNIGL